MVVNYKISHGIYCGNFSRKIVCLLPANKFRTLSNKDKQKCNSEERRYPIIECGHKRNEEVKVALYSFFGGKAGNFIAVRVAAGLFTMIPRNIPKFIVNNVCAEFPLTTDEEQSLEKSCQQAQRD